MRILNINKFHYMRGGVERYYFGLTKLLEDNGHDVIHFSMHDKRNFKSQFSEYFVSNVELKKPGLALLNKALRPIWSFEAVKNLEKLLDKYNPDIAHIHMLYHHLSPSILSLLKKRNIPVVMTLHDYKLICPNYLLFTKNNVCKQCKGHKYFNAIKNKCLKNSYLVSTYGALEMTTHKLMQIYENNVDAMIAPSEFVRNTFIEFGQNPEKITVIPHFVNPQFLDTVSPQNDKEKGAKYMLFFGRLAQEKGVDKVLEMMYIYKSGIKLKIAGSGPMEEYLKEYVSRRGLADKVEFLGHLDAKQLIRQIKNAQMVIMPSRFYEPFGFSALETMALGTPLVASNSGALGEIVPTELGRLFKRDDLSEMYMAVEEVATWKKGDLSSISKKLIEEKYLPKLHYQSLKTIYDHLLQ